MTYIEWFEKMHLAGWHVHSITKKNMETSVEWRHESATKADGKPISIDDDCANEHWLAGTTPPAILRR